MRAVFAIVLLSLASMACAYSDNRLHDLVGNISDGNYDAAVQTTIQLHREKRDDLIRETIDSLFQNSIGNLIEYTLRLRNDGGGSIVERVFPAEVLRLFEGRTVRLINKQDNNELKLRSNTDSQGYREAYGSAMNSFSWGLSFHWDNSKVYFHIYGIQYYQFLKLAYDPENNGDGVAYGDYSASNSRYQWSLVPAKIDGQYLFYIVNKEYNQALKLGRTVNAEHERVAYGHNGIYRNNPEKFGWFINEY